ncbi:MAG: hypothetical protein ABSF52_00635 [Syntrophobacteraceae bacterium]|jgi:predicted RNA-binding protein YlqC (UPF0109 family)
MLKELIETMVTVLVDAPEQVKVFEIEGGMTSIIELRAAKADRGIEFDELCRPTPLGGP